MDDADENAQNDDVIGYDKAAQQFADEYYGNGNYTSDESGSDEESSDENSDQESSDEKSDQESSDQSEDEDHKYTYKYKYKYAYKPDKPNDKYRPDKPSDEPKDKPKDDKQTDQKYSVNCTTVSTVRQCPLYDTDDESEDERPIVSYETLRLSREAMRLWEETKILLQPQPLLPNVCSSSPMFVVLPNIHLSTPLFANVCCQCLPEM